MSQPKTAAQFNSGLTGSYDFKPAIGFDRPHAQMSLHLPSHIAELICQMAASGFVVQDDEQSKSTYAELFNWIGVTYPSLYARYQVIWAERAK